MEFFIKKEVINITKMIAIDSSTNKSGIAIYKNGQFKSYKLLDYSNDKKMNSRFKKMSVALIEMLNEQKPDIVYIEETVVLRNAQTQRFLTRLQGVVAIWCFMNNCEFNTIRPTQWRKLIHISQSKNIKREQLKQSAIAYVKEKYNLDVSDDIADAICIGDAVLKMFGIE